MIDQKECKYVHFLIPFIDYIHQFLTIHANHHINNIKYDHQIDKYISFRSLKGPLDSNKERRSNPLALHTHQFFDIQSVIVT